MIHIKWPKCKIPGCNNGACLRLQSKYCYPHSNSKLDKLLKFAIYSEKVTTRTSVLAKVSGV